VSDTLPPPRPGEPGQYAIRVAGHLDQRWANWFDGLTLTAQTDGTTVLDGPVVDQAALHGVLHKIRDLGLLLLSVTPAPPDIAATPPGPIAENGADPAPPATTTTASTTTTTGSSS
jgi:hypothetical protein